MKTYNNLYEKICLLDNLRAAFKKARKGKSQKPYVKEFEANLEANLLALKRELETLTYEPRPLRIFAIRDPKTRLISAPHFRDRIVHHALCNVVEPIFDRTFIHDSYASRKGKGTHAALARFDRFKRQVSHNGKLVNGAIDNNLVCGYALKCDIRHYFTSVDHRILLRIIGRKIRDENVMRLIGKILSSYAPSGKGMPIGALTSQLFANIYLNELDYFIKHTLRAHFYIRYMDDFLVLHESAEKLAEWKNRIAAFLGRLNLELHPEKSKAFPLHHGVNFVGYRIFCCHKLLKRSNICIIGVRLNEFEILYANRGMTRAEIVQRVESWMAYARYANTYKFRKSVARRLNLMLAAKPQLFFAASFCAAGGASLRGEASMPLSCIPRCV